jgi:hypothetical protein
MTRPVMYVKLSHGACVLHTLILKTERPGKRQDHDSPTLQPPMARIDSSVYKTSQIVPGDALTYLGERVRGLNGELAGSDCLT